ncbi:MAG: adenylate/guanylate cyclase domain-containing protein [Vulcanimicrobiaceae bacterium]
MTEQELAEIPLFEGVQPALFKLLHRIATFAPGDELIVRGDEPKHILIIRSGEVAVHVGKVHLATRGRDSVLGEQAFINEGPHSTTCTAVTPVEAVCIPADVARAFLRDPAFVENLLRDLSNKLRASTNERYHRFGAHQLLFAEFSSHVHPKVLEDLLNDDQSYGAPQQVNDVAVLFSDIRGFTKYVHEAGRENSVSVAEELSAYLSAMTDLLHQRGAFVDKFIGDAVMAFWGYPRMTRPENDAVLACAEKMIALASRHTFGGDAACIGVGIEQGTCFMGNVGNDKKRQFTIIGDTVNVASRLEAKTKDLGNIVVGATFFNGLSPQQQARLQLHPNQDVRGAGLQPLYSINVGGQ